MNNIKEFNRYLRGFNELASELDQRRQTMVEDLKVDAVALFMKHALGQPQGRLRCDPAPQTSNVSGGSDMGMTGSSKQPSSPPSKQP